MRRLATTVLVAAFAAAPAHAQAPDVLPDGATIANVAVGGMAAPDADQAVRSAIAPVYEKRPIAIRVAHSDSLVTPAQAGLEVEYTWMVDRAFALAHAGKPVVVPLHLGIAKAKLAASIAAAGKRWFRAPRDARVRFGVTAIRRVAARLGRSLDQ